MRDSNRRPCPAVSELSTRANVGGEGERLPSCCSEAREADGGRRDTERQIAKKTADAFRYTAEVVFVSAFDRVDLAVVVSSKEPSQRYAQRVRDRP
jgi:hypothetical protein